MNPKLMLGLAAIAPGIMDLWKTMDGGAQHKLEALLPSVLPLLPISDDLREQALKVLADPGDLPTKLMSLASLPGVSDAFSGDNKAASETPYEFFVKCHKCGSHRYIELPH